MDPKIHEFIERARASGASDQSIVGILAARGWPEKEVYEVLASHYERLTGVEVPRRGGGAGTAAKDAFFYLLVFSTLATWTIALGSLAFTLIDQWLPDTLFTGGYRQVYTMYNIAGAMAAIIVAFPLYLLIQRTLNHDVRRNPDKFNSPVRRWLTYLALVCAAGVFIGDLITILTYLLRGEITSRFIAKAFVVLIISGGVFFYYFVGLRKQEEPEIHHRFSRDALMAMISAGAIILIVILGFANIGGPGTQRTLRADQKRVQDLYQLSTQINQRWKANGELPEHLDELRGVALADPVTRNTYEYRNKTESEYELCAVFAAASPQQNANRTPDTWAHPAGHHCFSLNASGVTENPNVYLPD